jgi:hypothetical protein
VPPAIVAPVCGLDTPVPQIGDAPAGVHRPRLVSPTRPPLWSRRCPRPP